MKKKNQYLNRESNYCEYNHQIPNNSSFNFKLLDISPYHRYMLKFHPTSSPLSNAIPFQSNKSQPTTRHSTLHSITQSADSHSSCTVARVCLRATIFLYQSAEFHCSTAITVALSFAFDLTNSLLAHHNSCLLICDFHQSIRSHILIDSHGRSIKVRLIVSRQSHPTTDLTKDYHPN